MSERHILIIEDNPADVRLMREALPGVASVEEAGEAGS